MVWPFSRSKKKFWKINNHKIKKYQKYRRVHPDGMASQRAPAGEGYKCVHCEKTHDNRDSFKDEECYNVIYE